MSTFRYNDGDTAEEISSAIRAYMLNSSRSSGGAIADIVATLVKDLVEVRKEVAVLSSMLQTNEALQTLIGLNALPFSDALVASVEAPDSYSTIASDVWDPANGFYFLEWTSTGEAYRWVGPKPYCEFEFAIDRETPKAFALTVIGCHGDFAVEDIICTIDGRSVALTVAPREDGEDGAILSGEIPSLLGRTSAKLRFIAPLVTPASGDDDRELCFTVSALTVDEAVSA